MKQYFILSVLMLLSSCSASGETEQKTVNLTVSKTELSVPYGQSEQTLTVTSDCDWGVYAQDKTWITVSPEGGIAGTVTVTLDIAANEGLHPRDNVLTFKYGTERMEIPVHQDSVPYIPEVKDTTITAPQGYHLVWHDEFDADKVNTSQWKFENWAPGYVNNELQRYVAGGVLDGVYTAFIEDGVLNIQALKHKGQVISARMNSMQSWKYGYFEARIKLPKGKGTWPAFWMMPKDQSLGWPNCGEIDIMEEVGVDANQTSSSIHTTNYNHTKSTQKTKSRYTKGAESEFHTYAVEWREDGIYAYVDGVHDGTTLTFLNDGQGNNGTWPFNKPFFLILNLAWGGSWGGYAGVDENALPATMQIDYVRVFQKDE